MQKKGARLKLKATDCKKKKKKNLDKEELF